MDDKNKQKNCEEQKKSKVMWNQPFMHKLNEKSEKFSLFRLTIPKNWALTPTGLAPLQPFDRSPGMCSCGWENKQAWCALRKIWQRSATFRKCETLRLASTIRLGVGPKDGWKWKWSKGVNKLKWTISDVYPARALWALGLFKLAHSGTGGDFLLPNA